MDLGYATENMATTNIIGNFRPEGTAANQGRNDCHS